MNTPNLARRLVLLALLGATAGSSGCSHLRRGSAMLLASADYEQIFVTGSNIPVLVPKSPTARRPPSISPTVVLTPEDLTRSLGPGVVPMH